jgi:hypothetical protein
MGKYLRILALFTVLFSVNAHADEFVFFTPWGVKFNSADAACQYTASQYKGAGLDYSYNGSFSISGDEYVCNGTVDGSPGIVGRDAWKGDSCPADMDVRPGGGGCVAKPPAGKCSDKKGQFAKSFHWFSATDEPSKTISVDGCAADISGFTVCKTASPSVYSCTGTATWSGEELEASSGSGTTCEGADCHKDDPQSGTKNEPCIKQDTGAGFTCTSTVEDSKVGQTSCGTANGVYVCTASSKPAKTTVTESVKQESSANPDGSMSTKNITTTTKTTCVADKCTTTSYTTTTKGGTTGQGQPVPDSTSCTGDDCPSQTKGGGGGGGSVGSGGKDDDGSAESSGDCAKPPACDGDVFMCALLDQNFKDSCSLKALPTAKEISDKDQAIQKEVNEVQAAQDQMDSDVSGLLSGFKAAATSGGAGGKCYPDKEFTIKGSTIAMPFSKICEPLILLRYALIAGAYLIAARILSREA